MLFLSSSWALQSEPSFARYGTFTTLLSRSAARRQFVGNVYMIVVACTWRILLNIMVMEMLNYVVKG